MSYPPAQTNQLQQALDRRDTMMTVPLNSDSSPTSRTQLQSTQESREDQIPEEEKEAMRLKGGCIDLSPCGCDCEFCCIPCTIM
ncbi:hypothetical protein JCM3765_000723 [Sporobolomyces pararoseus]